MTAHPQERDIDIEALASRLRKRAYIGIGTGLLTVPELRTDGSIGSTVIKTDGIDHDLADAANLLDRLRAQPSPRVPPTLCKETADLMMRFAEAMMDKLAKAQEKYGYNIGWMDDDWREECQRKFAEHAAKGDPLDVANFCAFMWHHGWSSVSVSPREVALIKQVLKICKEVEEHEMAEEAEEKKTLGEIYAHNSYAAGWSAGAISTATNIAEAVVSALSPAQKGEPG